MLKCSLLAAIRYVLSDIAAEFMGRGEQIHLNSLSYSEIREATPIEINDFAS